MTKDRSRRPSIAEAEPLLQICQQALEPAYAGRDALGEEHEIVAAECQVGSSVDPDEQDTVTAEATPIYDAVMDGELVNESGRGRSSRLSSPRVRGEVGALARPPDVAE
ncbi:hypothetical protein [Amycolatopsis sp. NPDC003731]